MDALVRRRRRVLIATVVVAIGGAACVGRGGTDTPVGITQRPPLSGARDADSDGAIEAGAAALPAGYRTSFAKVNRARFVSQGHAAGRWDVDVYANELAQKALAARARDVPVGAVVVQEHFERSEGRPTGPVMVMEKRDKSFSPEHGGWRYAVIGSQGQLVKDGVIEQCAGCHDDAPMDGLFPIVE